MTKAFMCRNTSLISGSVIKTTLLLSLFCMHLKAQDHMPLELEKLGSAINTAEYDETSPVVSWDGTTLFFTRTADPHFNRTLMNGKQDESHQMDETAYLEKLARIYSMLSGNEVQDPVNSKFNQDIWMASTNPEFPNVVHPGYPVNNALPNSIVSTAKDSNSYILINQFYSDGSMYEGFSRVTMGPGVAATFPEPIHIYNFDARQGDVNLCMSADGDVLIISMSRFDAHGQNDLYVSFRLKHNLYSSPKNMGPVLNTTGQETTPYVSRDKRRLYFSSDRPGSMGGNDIYVSERQDYTWCTWSEPRPLGAPFNSPADDSQPYFDEVNNYLYFSSKRDGSSDLFRVSLTPVPNLKEPVKISGRIVDRSTGEVIPAELFWGPGSASGFLEFFRTNTGFFTATLTENEVYKFMPRKANYETRQIHFDVRQAAEQGRYTHEMTLYLTPKEKRLLAADEVPSKPAETVERGTGSEAGEEGMSRLEFIRESDLKVGKKISFYNIFFVKSTPQIREKSNPALKELVYVMQQRPNLEIRIEGHTDNVGDPEKNMELSLQRANAIKAYLTGHGIEPGRIRTKGFGPFAPITNNATEELRQQNRRVEIRILGE